MAWVFAACAAEGIGVLARRDVPIEPAALGDAARASLPDVVQLVLVWPLGVDGEEAERRAYRARRADRRRSQMSHRPQVAHATEG